MSEKNEWKLVPVEPTDDMEAAAEDDYEQTGATFPRWKSAYAAMLAAAPASPSLSSLGGFAPGACDGMKSEDYVNKVRNDGWSSPDCTPAPSAPGDAQDERQAFEAWAERKKMPLARIGQQYDDFWVDHAWNGWQARARLSAPAAGDALDAARYRALVWVCEQGADMLNAVCASAGVDEEISPERLKAIAEAALAAQVPQQGEA